jgi:hypothetical protein
MTTFTFIKKTKRRNTAIVRRRLKGELPHQIRRAMKISRNVVAGVLTRAGLSGKEEGAHARSMKTPTSKRTLRAGANRRWAARGDTGEQVIGR